MTKNKFKIVLGVTTASCVIAVVIVAVLLLTQSGGRKYDKYLELAAQYLEEMEYEKAIAELRSAIDIDPSNREAYLALADVYVEMGNYESAIAVLEEGYFMTGDDKFKERMDFYGFADEVSRDQTSEDGTSDVDVDHIFDEETMSVFREVYDLLEEKDYYGLLKFANSYDNGSLSSGAFFRDRLQGIYLYDGETVSPFRDGKGLVIAERTIGLGEFRAGSLVGKSELLYWESPE